MDSITISLLGGCIATIIPLLFVCGLVKDINSRYVLLYFCWGTLSGLLSYGLNNYFAAEPEQAARVYTSIAPIVEELCKGAPLLLFLIKRKISYTPILIVYCALASGVGFSIQESIFYFAQSSGQWADIVTLTVRTMTTALMHGMCTAILGTELMLMKKHKHILFPMIIGLFALSTGIHALFNLLLPTKLAVVAMLLPIGLFFAGLTFLSGFEDEAEASAHET